MRTLDGSLAEVLAQAGTTGDDYLRVRLREVPRVGLAEEVREGLPHCVDVQVIRPDADPTARPEGPAVDRVGLGPTALFRQYLVETRGGVDEALLALFGQLLDEHVQ